MQNRTHTYLLTRIFEFKFCLNRNSMLIYVLVRDLSFYSLPLVYPLQLLTSYRKNNFYITETLRKKNR